MAQVSCLECGHSLKLDKPKIGAKIKCPECGSQLEVIDLDPIELDWVYDDDDDLDDDDDFDDDDWDDDESWGDDEE